MKPNILVGGQAVIEGVMMRVPGAYSTAVRDPDGNIKIISYSPNLISLQAETEGGALLVLSEIFYEPGWKCKVDDQLVPIYQTNHILRSVYVPGGSHKVEFYYDSSDWKMAKVFSRFTFY